MVYLVLLGIVCSVAAYSVTGAYVQESKTSSRALSCSGFRSYVRLGLLKLRNIPFIWNLLQSRQRTLSSYKADLLMPEFLDILSLGLSAGLSFDASLELYCTHSISLLSQEFAKAMQLWQMGLTSRSLALEELGQRLGSDSVQRFCHAVCEALSFGMPLSKTLEHQSELMRSEQRARTQERIEEVPVRMLIPLGTLVVPAMLLAILGPLLSSALYI